MLYEFDASFYQDKPIVLCGIDEAGRGPLAGPVSAAAVVLDPTKRIEGLGDSKKLTPEKRERLYPIIIENAQDYAIAFASPQEIDTLNILQATLLAMRRAVAGLQKGVPQLLLVDGISDPQAGIPARLVTKGDNLSASIAAASILAKVARDRMLVELEREYPEYGFAQHKGYGTKQHYAMLDQYGPCPVHRASFLKKWRANQ